MHLSAIDLDFHPIRSRSRRRLQTLATYLLGAEPEKLETSTFVPTWGEETVTTLAGPAVTLVDALVEGPAILAGAGARVAKLLADIRERAPLTHKTP